LRRRPCWTGRPPLDGGQGARVGGAEVEGRGRRPSGQWKRRCQNGAGRRGAVRGRRRRRRGVPATGSHTEGTSGSPFSPRASSEGHNQGAVTGTRDVAWESQGLSKGARPTEWWSESGEQREGETKKREGHGNKTPTQPGNTRCRHLHSTARDGAVTDANAGVPPAHSRTSAVVAAARASRVPPPRRGATRKPRHAPGLPAAPTHPRAPRV